MIFILRHFGICCILIAAIGCQDSAPTPTRLESTREIEHDGAWNPLWDGGNCFPPDQFEIAPGETAMFRVGFEIPKSVSGFWRSSGKSAQQVEAK